MKTEGLLEANSWRWGEWVKEADFWRRDITDQAQTIGQLRWIAGNWPWRPSRFELFECLSLSEWSFIALIRQHRALPSRWTIVDADDQRIGAISGDFVVDAEGWRFARYEEREIREASGFVYAQFDENTIRCNAELPFHPFLRMILLSFFATRSLP